MSAALLNIRLFFQGALLSYIALFRWLQPSTYLASKVVGPLSYMIFFVFLGEFGGAGNGPFFYVVGNAVQMAATSGIYGVTMSIAGDRWDGTLPYLFASPANRMTLFIGRAFIHVIDGMVGVLLGLFWGVVLFSLDLSQADPLALLLTILVTTFSTSGLGLALGSLSLITRNVMFVNNTVFFLLLIFSGANIAIDTLPVWMQTISWSLPLTRGIVSAREIVAGGSLADVASLLTTEFGIGVVFVVIGYSMFRWFEIQARKRGTLDAI